MAILVGALSTPDGGVRVASDDVKPVSLPRGVSPSRVESRTFWSVNLGREMPYYIFLPPGYDSNTAMRFPTLYMLHGYSGTNDEWKWYGIFEKADRLFRSGEVPSFIIVLPQGDYSYWMNHANGGPAWGTYTARDVVAEIDSRFRTAADYEHRAVGGLSMGAHGALQLAINFPGVFKVVGAHSPSLRDFEIAYDFFGDREYFDAHDPFVLFRVHADVARTLILSIDVGGEDDWRPVVLAFHQQLEADGIPHLLQEYPGTHNQDYWEINTSSYLRFYGAALGGPVNRSPVASATAVGGTGMFVSTPMGTTATCPASNQWLGLYWWGTSASILTALQACPNARQAWVRRETSWLGAAPDRPGASDQFDIASGEFIFLRG